MKLPRYIKPETIHIGDTVKVTKKTKDAEVSIVGIVANRDYEGGYRVLRTEGEVELLRWHPSINEKNKATVTLLQESKTRNTMPEPLF